MPSRKKTPLRVGDFPPMDEDGCCTLCGADCHIEGLAIFAEEQEARADAAEAKVAALEAKLAEVAEKL